MQADIGKLVMCAGKYKKAGCVVQADTGELAVLADRGRLAVFYRLRGKLAVLCRLI